MPSKFQIKTQGQVLSYLEKHGPNDINTITTALNASYDSVRNAVRELERLGKVKAQSGLQHRNVKYVLGESDAMIHDSIPRYKGIKISEFMRVYELSPRESNAAMAVMNLPRHVTKLLQCAVELTKGNKVDLPLNILREQMEQDFTALKSVVHYYETILNEHGNWTPEFLSRYPSDLAWDDELFNKAKEHYEIKD